MKFLALAILVFSQITFADSSGFEIHADGRKLSDSEIAAINGSRLLTGSSLCFTGDQKLAGEAVANALESSANSRDVVMTQQGRLIIQFNWDKGVSHCVRWGWRHREYVCTYSETTWLAKRPRSPLASLEWKYTP